MTFTNTIANLHNGGRVSGPPPPFTPPTSIHPPSSASNSKHSFTFNSSTASNSLPSFTPTSPLSNASTTNLDEQSSITPSLPLRTSRLPMAGRSEDGLSKFEVEHEELITLYEDLMVDLAEGAPEDIPWLQGLQRTLECFRRWHSQEQRNRKTRDGTDWDVEKANNMLILREWIMFRRPREEIAENMRQIQRDEVASLASRATVYPGWAGNRYGVPGLPVQEDSVREEGGETRRGWTGW